MKIMMLIVVNEGIVGILLLVRVKKIKARRAKLFQQRKNGKKINQIVQTIDQQGEKPIIIITIVRVV